jgi:hypothetical protein
LARKKARIAFGSGSAFGTARQALQDEPVPPSATFTGPLIAI